jgi:hypothetical protein
MRLIARFDPRSRYARRIFSFSSSEYPRGSGPGHLVRTTVLTVMLLGPAGAMAVLRRRPEEPHSLHSYVSWIIGQAKLVSRTRHSSNRKIHYLLSRYRSVERTASGMIIRGFLASGGTWSGTNSMLIKTGPKP